MLGAAGQAFQELFTPPFRAVLWKCVGFTVALLALLIVALEWSFSYFVAWPDWIETAIQWLGGLALVVWKVFYANYRAHGAVPGLNMLVPFAALYVWWLPVTRQFEFYFLLTPMFHSLQYLAFVYKLEGTRLRGESHRELKATALISGLVLAGWLAFEMVPNTLDNALGTFAAWRMFFFFTAAMLFINVHHYFIDNVLWRFKDPEIRGYLLS